MVDRKLLQRLGVFLALLALSVGISVGDEKARLSVLNSTGHYLHVIVDESSYLYLAPSSAATHEADGYSVFLVKVFYAPGQGVSGEAERTFRVAPYEPPGTGCRYSGRDGFTCAQEPSTGGAQLWEVTPDTLGAPTFWKGVQQ